MNAARRLAAMAVAIAVMAAAASARALETQWPNDQNAKTFRLYNLPAPNVGTAALRLQDVAIGACIPKSSGVNGTFSCTTPGTDFENALTFTLPLVRVTNAISISTNGIGNTQLRQGTATSVVGNPTGSTANLQDIACSADGQFIGRAGGALVCTSTIPATSAPLTATFMGYGSGSNLVTGSAGLTFTAATGLTRMTGDSTTGAPALALRSSLGTLASPATVTNATPIGSLLYMPYDGTSFLSTVQSGAHVTSGATVATNSVPSSWFVDVNATGVTADPFTSGTTRIGLQVVPPNNTANPSSVMINEVAGLTPTASFQSRSIAGSNDWRFRHTTGNLILAQLAGTAGTATITNAGGLTGQGMQLVNANPTADVKMVNQSGGATLMLTSASGSVAPTSFPIWGFTTGLRGIDFTFGPTAGVAMTVANYERQMFSVDLQTPGEYSGLTAGVDYSGSTPWDGYRWRGPLHYIHHAGGGNNTAPNGLNLHAMYAPQFANVILLNPMTAVSASTLWVEGPPVNTTPGPPPAYSLTFAEGVSAIHVGGANTTTSARLDGNLQVKGATGITVDVLGTAMTKSVAGVLAPAVSGTDFAPAGNYITSLTTDVVAAGPGAAVATIQPDAVNYAKMQNVSAASRLLGRGSAAGAGDPQEIILGTGLSMSGTTLNAAVAGGTVTNVTATDPATSSGGTAPDIGVKFDNVSVSLNGGGGLQRGALSGDATAIAGSNAVTVPGIAATFITQTASANLANEQALGALASGILSSVTTTGIVSSFAVGAQRIPFGSGTNGRLTDDDHLKINGATFGLGSLQEVQVYNDSTNATALAGYRIGTDSGFANGFAFSMTGTNWSPGGGLVARQGLIELNAGNVPLLISNLSGGAAAGVSIATGGSRTVRFSIDASTGGVTLSSLGLSNGLVKGVSGLLTLATANVDYQTPVTWPLANRIEVSPGPSSTPVGNSAFQWDIANRVLYLGAAATQSWSNLNDLGAGTYERVTAAWASNIWSLTSEMSGGTIRAMRIRSTAGVTIDDHLEVNGANPSSNDSMTVAAVTNNNRDHVKLFVGGGALQDTASNTLIDIIPSNTAVGAGNNGGVLSTLRVRSLVYTGTGTPSEAASVFVDAPSFGGPTGPTYALHVAGGKTRLGGAVQLDSMVGPGSLAVDGSGNVSVQAYGATETKRDYYVGVTVASPLNAGGAWVATSSPSLVNTATPVEYPNAFIAGHVQATFDLMVQTGVSNPVICSVTLNGTPITGASLVFSIGITASGIYPTSTVATGSASINDTFGMFCSSASPTTGATATFSSQVVLTP